MVNPLAKKTQPGSIVRVRRGTYETADGRTRRGWSHMHTCSVPGCPLFVDCEAQPYVAPDADDMPQARWGCVDIDVAPLCTQHERENVCAYCGEYGHDEGHCADKGCEVTA